MQDKSLSNRATHLLGEVIQLGNLLLPPYVSHKLQAMPGLVAMALNSTIPFEQSARARLAIQNLAAFSRSRESLAGNVNEV